MAEGTFLVANIRGFVRFMSEKGNAAAASLDTRFADLLSQGTAIHGGAVTARRGGEAVALFGSASQAVRAALEVQDLFGMEMDVNSALPLSVGIGLAAGSYADVASTHVGLTPKLAECLCALAGPGEILVSESIRVSVGEALAAYLVERGQVQFRGFQDPITVFQVVPPPRGMDKTSRRQ